MSNQRIFNMKTFQAPAAALSAILSAGCMLTLAKAGSEVQHRTISANGIKLHDVVTGEGEPVVLVPGWPESWSTL
jgi:hypothetical protein